MDSDHFYVTLFSNASQKLYPSNTISAFRAQLAKPVELGHSDRWEVALVEITCPPSATVATIKPVLVVGDTNALVYCDVIAPQFIGNSLARVLRVIVTPKLYGRYDFKTLVYLPVEKRSFQDIRIEVLDLEGKRIPFKSSKNPLKVIIFVVFEPVLYKDDVTIYFQHF